MKNLIRSTTQLALSFASQYLSPGDAAIDATCGNGNDTVALARMGAGKIYAFDIQKKAIEQTRAALIREKLYSENIRLIEDSHEHMADYITEKVKVILFNLGYLPSGAKTLVTKKETTLSAVAQGLTLLRKDGLLCATMYSGHPGGIEEKQALLDFAKSLDEKKYHVAYLNMLNQWNHPPELLLITLKWGVEHEKDENRMHAGTCQQQ